MLVGNCNFSLPLAFNAPFGVFPLEPEKKFGPQKTRIMGLPGSEDSLTIGWDRRSAYINNVRSMTDAR